MHGHIEELLSGYALGAANEAEEAQVIAHVRECRSCAASLGRHLEVASALSLSAEEVTPPAGLRERILNAAIADDKIVRPRDVASNVRTLKVIRWNPTASLAVAAAVVVIGLVGWNVSLQQRLGTTESLLASNQVQRGEMRSLAGASVGAVSYLSRDNLALVSFHGLTRPVSKVYELWVIDAAGHADPIQTFLPDGDGSKLVVVSRRLASSDQLAVTEEPLGGSPTPSSAPIFLGKI